MPTSLIGTQNAKSLSTRTTTDDQGDSCDGTAAQRHGDRRSKGDRCDGDTGTTTDDQGDRCDGDIGTTTDDQGDRCDGDTDAEAYTVEENVETLVWWGAEAHAEAQFEARRVTSQEAHEAPVAKNVDNHVKAHAEKNVGAPAGTHAEALAEAHVEVHSDATVGSHAEAPEAPFEENVNNQVVHVEGLVDLHAVGGGLLP